MNEAFHDALADMVCREYEVADAEGDNARLAGITASLGDVLGKAVALICDGDPDGIDLMLDQLDYLITTVAIDAGEDLVVVSNQDRIARGEAPDGTPYAPRSQATIDRYNALGISYGAPLNVTGELRLSLAPSSGPDYAMASSNAIQAAVMHFGAARGAFGQDAGGSLIPWGTIPARPVLGVSDDDVTAIRAEIAEWLEATTD